MATATQVRRSKTEAPRRPWPVERGTTNFINSNIAADSLTSRRAQRLVALFGLSEHRARLVADLAWGGFLHG